MTDKAKPTPSSGDDPNESLAVHHGFALGQLADGTFDIFPLSELAERTRLRDQEEAAQQYALEQSEAGFPDESEEDDLSDLEDIESLAK